MTTEAWPFLVSRSRGRDYKPVVAPRFLIERGATSLLMSRVRLEETGQGSSPAYANQFPDTAAGPVTVVYRTRRAVRGGEALRDHASRPVMRVEGVVVRGLHDSGTVPDAVLEQAAHAADRHFDAFWQSDGAIGVVGSEPFAPSQPKTPPLRPSGQTIRPRLLYAGLAGIVLVGLAGYTIFELARAPVRQLRQEVGVLTEEVAGIGKRVGDLETELARLRSAGLGQKPPDAASRSKEVGGAEEAPRARLDPISR